MTNFDPSQSLGAKPKGEIKKYLRSIGDPDGQPEYRLYTFVNWMLSSIQQGIQTAHVVHELFESYDNDSLTGEPSLRHQMLREWSFYHKTIIVLNGGTQRDLNELFLQLHRDTNMIESESGYAMPFAAFNEDEESLGSLMTAVGIVVPSPLYEAKFVESWEVHDIEKGETRWFNSKNTATGRFLNVLKSANLAR